MTEETATNRAKRDRPGCVTAYAILLWIASVLTLLSAVFVVSPIGMMGLMLSGSGFESILVMAGFGLLLTTICVVTGIGLWRMKKWSWALVVVLHGTSLVLGLLSMALILLRALSDDAGMALTRPADVVSIIAGALASGFILYWFIKNRALFDGTPTYKKVIGRNGEEIVAPVQSKNNDAMMLLAVGVGLVLVLILVCAVVIAMLAILSPQIGNVFSQITNELENAAPAVVPQVW